MDRQANPWPCPKCYSTDCSISEIKKFSGAGAIKGALISGPFAIPGAIVGGLLGEKKAISTCHNCGHSWEVTNWRF